MPIDVIKEQHQLKQNKDTNNETTVMTIATYTN